MNDCNGTTISRPRGGRVLQAPARITRRGLTRLSLTWQYPTANPTARRNALMPLCARSATTPMTASRTAPGAKGLAGAGIALIGPGALVAERLFHNRARVSRTSQADAATPGGRREISRQRKPPAAGRRSRSTARRSWRSRPCRESARPRWARAAPLPRTHDPRLEAVVMGHVEPPRAPASVSTVLDRSQLREFPRRDRPVRACVTEVSVHRPHSSEDPTPASSAAEVGRPRRSGS
jgi:hypothetical protein